MRNTACLLFRGSDWETSSKGKQRGLQLFDSLKPGSFWKIRFTQINVIGFNVQITIKCNGPCHIKSLILNGLMDLSSFKSQWINYSPSPSVSSLTALREEAHCLSAVVISTVISSCMSAFTTLCLCPTAEWGFWDLPSSCWFTRLCWPIALKQVGCYKGVILFSFSEVLL